MKDLKARLPVLLAALWWGSLSAIGFVVVPLLFANLPTPAMAGAMAARLFTAQSWLSLACGLLLLLATIQRQDHDGKDEGRRTADWAQPVLFFVMSGLLLALLAEYGAAPRIVARENLRFWHAVGSGMYLLQWLCTTVVLYRLAGGRPGGQGASGHPPLLD